jgi:ABC-type lipoprotein release transport system permease subunit
MKIRRKDLKKLIESFLISEEDEDVKKPSVEDDTSLIDILKAVKKTAEKIADDDEKTKILIPPLLAKKLGIKPGDDTEEVKLTKKELDDKLRNSREVQVIKNKAMI